MKHPARLLAILIALATFSPLQAAVTVTRLEGFNKTWQFMNTDLTYKDMNNALGYYKDYNGDGMPDYLIALKNPTTDAMRLFTLNTAASATIKSYSSHRTAWRDFAALKGSFVPRGLYTPRSPKVDTNDLVVVGTNSGSTDGAVCSRFTFYRLKKTDKAWPTEKTWSISLPFSAHWVMQWPEVSYNNDDYPDFFIYNAVAPATPSTSRRFVLSLYNGLTGGLIWQKSLALDPGDKGPIYPSMPSTSILIVHDLPLLPAKRFGNGDFDNDGKPEFVLYYTYSTLNLLAGSINYTAMLKVLNSSGNPLSPYTSGWTRVSPTNAVSPWLYSMNSDLDQDGYRDMVLQNPKFTPGDTMPVFQGYSLKKRLVLFTAVNSDFGAKADDSADYRTYEAAEFKRASPISLTTVPQPDLHPFRDRSTTYDDMGKAITRPLRIGLFNGYGGSAGRKVYLSPDATFTNFDHVQMMANDFNYDNIMDFAVVKTPTTPSTPKWTIGNTAVGRTGISLGKQFTYTMSATGVKGTNQEYLGASAMVGYFGDMDGNSQRDTWASLFWSLTNNSTGLTDRAGASVVLYNTPPSSSTAVPARFAAMDLLVQNSSWSPLLILATAKNINQYMYVDNDKDAISDDVIVWGPGVVFALNFQKRGIFPAAGQAQTPTPATGGTLSVNRPLLWEPTDGALICSAYDVYLGTNKTSVTNAKNTSPEYRGNQNAPLYLPRPALTAGLTYYWRVDTINPWGKITKGVVWSFKAVP